jgi:hypothetical protein
MSMAGVAICDRCSARHGSSTFLPFAEFDKGGRKRNECRACTEERVHATQKEAQQKAKIKKEKAQQEARQKAKRPREEHGLVQKRPRNE